MPERNIATAETATAEQMLYDGEQRYRQLFTDSAAVKFIIDPDDGQIIDANQAAADFYGYTVSELKQLKICSINTAPPAEVKAMMATACSNSAGLFLFRHRLKSGQVRDVEIYAGPLWLAGKRRLLSIVFDVSERSKMKEELRASRERLALVIEGAKAGIWETDLISGRAYYSKQWKSILGHEEDEIGDSGEEWRSRVHPEDRALVEAARLDYLAGVTDKYKVESRVRHKDGSYRWVLTTGKVTRGEDGRPLRLTGSNIDITGLKQLEEARQESEAKLRDFARAVPDISFIIDEDGRYIEVFTNNEELLQRPLEEYRGLTIHQLFPADQADMLLNEIRQTIMTGTPRIFIQEVEVRGVKRTLERRTAPMRYLADGKRTVATIAVDISKRREVERLLQAAYELRRRSDFLNDLVGGNCVVDEKFMAAAAGFGLDFMAPVCCCLIHLDETSGEDSRRRTNIIELLGEEERLLVWDCRGDIGVLCRVRADDGREGGRRIAGNILEKIGDYVPGRTVTVGASETHVGPEGIVKSYRQARSAVLAGRCQGGGQGGIYHYADVGLFQLLAGLGGEEQAAEFVQAKLGKLIEYDRAKGTDYLNTLEAILANASLKETAEKMFLHHKTLVFRKRRIEALLGRPVDLFEERLSLAAALKLHKLQDILR